jgi:hypothetical protein
VKRWTHEWADMAAASNSTRWLREWECEAQIPKFPYLGMHWKVLTFCNKNLAEFKIKKLKSQMQSCGLPNSGVRPHVKLWVLWKEWDLKTRPQCVVGLVNTQCLVSPQTIKPLLWAEGTLCPSLMRLLLSVEISISLCSCINRGKLVLFKSFMPHSFSDLN